MVVNGQEQWFWYYFSVII